MKKLRNLNRGLSIFATALLTIAAMSSMALSEQIPPDSEEYGILSGLVYSDDNNSATRESYEFGIPDVLVILEGLTEPLDPSTIFQMTTWTDAYGRYRFEDLPVGTYSLIEISPYEFVEGLPNAPGSLGGQVVSNNHFADIEVSAGDVGDNYNFGEWGLKIGYFSKRDFILDPAPEPSVAVLVAGLVCMGACIRRRS